MRRSVVVRFATVGFEQMCRIVKDKESAAAGSSGIVLIDVRSVDEVQRMGKIPFSINIPVNAVPTVLRDDFDKDEFEDTFGAEKPCPQTHRLVFYCMHGVRSATAATLAESLGFQSVASYAGSWAEWSARHSNPAK